MNLKKLHDFVENNILFTSIVALLIFTNIFLFVVEENIEFKEHFELLTKTVEYTSMIVFTFEYFARVISATVKKKYRHPIIGRIKFMLTPLELIDLIVVLHFYISILPVSIVFLRLIRLARFLHLTDLSSKKKFFFEVFEAKSTSKYHKIFAIFLIMLIIINVFVVLFEAIIPTDYNKLGFEFIEYLSLYFFTIEYLLRLWVCNLEPKYKNHNGRLRYALSPLAIIDLLSILPFYLPILIAFDFRILRLFRLARLVRVLKIEEFI